MGYFFYCSHDMMWKKRSIKKRMRDLWKKIVWDKFYWILWVGDIFFYLVLFVVHFFLSFHLILIAKICFNHRIGGRERKKSNKLFWERVFKTYSLCGISSSWSPATIPLSANKIVIKNPNKILWSIVAYFYLLLPYSSAKLSFFVLSISV